MTRIVDVLDPKEALRCQSRCWPQRLIPETGGAKGIPRSRRPSEKNADLSGVSRCKVHRKPCKMAITCKPWLTMDPEGLAKFLAESLCWSHSGARLSTCCASCTCSWRRFKKLQSGVDYGVSATTTRQKPWMKLCMCPPAPTGAGFWCCILA